MLFAVVSDVVWQTLIQVGFGSVVTILLALIGVWSAWMAREAAKKVAQVAVILEETTAKSDHKLNKLVEKVEAVHKTTNGLVDKLVDATAEAAKAKGKIEGINEERDRPSTPLSDPNVPRTGDKL